MTLAVVITVTPHANNFRKVTPVSLWTQGYSFSLKIKCWGISFICRSPRISERLHLHPCVHRDTALAFKIIYWGISFICRSPVINYHYIMKSKTLMSPTLMLLEDTNVSSSYIHLCYPKTLMSPALMLLEDTNGLQLMYTLMLLEDINVSSSYATWRH